MFSADQTNELALDQAAATVRRIAGPVACPLAIITGTGLAGLAGALTVEKRVPPEALPQLPQPGVVGHRGGILVGRLGTLGTLFFSGRVHLYEGWTPGEVASAARLSARLGAEILLITNATGGVAPLLRPGDLVLLTDQVNLTFQCVSGTPRAALRGASPVLYDPVLSALFREAARFEKINLHEGIYAGNLGPNYETRSEAAFLAQIDAAVVGMSTVAEVLAARQAGLRVVGISCVANRVPGWGSGTLLTHDDVVACVGSAAEKMKRLILRWSELVGSS